MIAPQCSRCLDEKLVRGAHPLLLVPCPECCQVTDPPEPPDLCDELHPDPEDIHDAPTIPAPPPIPSDRPTPLAPAMVTPEARPTPYRTALGRLPPLPIPREMKPKP